MVLDVFADVPHVMVCVKDAHGRYVGANEAFVQRTSKRTVREAIGRHARDLFPLPLARSYEAQDRLLLETGIPVRNRLEIITDRTRQPAWYLTTKTLDRSDPSSVFIVVVSSVAAIPGSGTAVGDGLRAAIDMAQDHAAAGIRVSDLARASGLSTDRLERSMKRVFGTTPKQFLLHQRIDKAARLISTTNRQLGEIAVSCGFYDQSQLTRQFKAAMGVTPGRYRSL